MKAASNDSHWAERFQKQIEEEEDSVKMVDWIPVETAAVLSSKSVVAVVNHGGAGSYSEAIWFLIYLPFPSSRLTFKLVPGSRK
jgi:hypothetical protein